MRRRPCTDANQPEIVRALRQAGAQVVILAGVGHGCPDLLVQYRERLYLLEVKMPGAWLNALEIKFHNVFKCYTVSTIAEALEVIGINI
jgi:Holliday junction resolvase